MELKHKDYKYINNTKNLPKFDIGKADYGSAISGAIETGASIYNAHQFTTTSDDYINKYGTTNASVGGIGYTKFNDIDKNAEMDIVSAGNTKNTLQTTAIGAGAGALGGLALGSAVGSIVPGIGTLVGAGIGGLVGLVGGLFGGKSRKRKAEQLLREALQRVDNYNDMNRSDALTASLNQEEAMKYGDTRSQTLFSYDEGKNSKDPISLFSPLKGYAETAGGLRFGPINSRVSKGEGIWNEYTGDANYITHGPNDTALAHLKQSDVVFGNLTNPFTENPFKVDAEPLIKAKQRLNEMRPKSKGWLAQLTQKTWETAVRPISDEIDNSLSQLAQVQKAVSGDANEKQNIKQGLPGFKPGKNSADLIAKKYGLGWMGNFLPALTGSIASLGLYIDAANDTPYAPNTYYANPYQQKGLRTLAELKTNPYPIIQNLRDAESRTNYAIQNSGGLSTAQKHLSRVASLNSTLQNIANALANLQDLDNKYKAQYANAALQYGESEATRRQSARQFDIDYYSKSHAARLHGMLMGMYNLMDTMNQYQANEFKRKNAIANLDMYQQLIDNDATDNGGSTAYTSKKPYVGKNVVNKYIPSYGLFKPYNVPNNVPKLNDPYELFSHKPIDYNEIDPYTQEVINKLFKFK